MSVSDHSLPSTPSFQQWVGIAQRFSQTDSPELIDILVNNGSAFVATDHRDLPTERYTDDMKIVWIQNLIQSRDSRGKRQLLALFLLQNPKSHVDLLQKAHMDPAGIAFAKFSACHLVSSHILQVAQEQERSRIARVGSDPGLFMQPLPIGGASGQPVQPASVSGSVAAQQC
jgi:hypothetical protein